MNVVLEYGVGGDLDSANYGACQANAGQADCGRAAMILEVMLIRIRSDGWVASGGACPPAACCRCAMRAARPRTNSSGVRLMAAAYVPEGDTA